MAVKRVVVENMVQMPVGDRQEWLYFILAGDHAPLNYLHGRGRIQL